MFVRHRWPQSFPWWLFCRFPREDAAADYECASAALWCSPIRPTPLEPISKLSEEDNEASELDKAEEVLGVVLPPDENTALPLYPREEAFDEPAPHVTA